MDLTTITTFLSQHGTWGILLAGVLTITSDWWLPRLKPLLNRTAMPEPTADDDVADVLALHRIQDRAKRNGCAKLQAAVRELEVCFFNHAEPTEAAK